ncbi:MAG: AsmA family protein [Desulfobacteraceae bacterium]|nr:MAG: AsmA family protein [Desulfobacteraceae bacterium]
MPIRKVSLALVGALILLSALLLGGASVYLNSAAFRRLLVERIDQAIAGHIHIRDLDLSLFTGKLTLSGVELSGADRQAIAGIGTLHLRVFWPALAWRSVDVTRIVLEKVQLDLIADARDRMNLSEALATSAREETNGGNGRLWQVAVGDLRLRDGQIAYHHQVKGWTGRLTNLEASGSGNLKQRRGQLRLSAEALNLQAPGLAENLRSITLDISYREGADRPVTVAIRSAESSLSAKARVERINGSVRVALSSGLDLSLAQIRPWLPQAPVMSGRITGNLDVTGLLVDPRVTVRLQLADGRVEGVPIGEAVLEARMDQRQVDIKRLDIRSSMGDLDLSGSIDLRPVFPDSFQSAAAGLETLEYVLDLDGRRMTPGQMPRLAFPWGGIWQTRLHVQGTGLSPARSNGTGRIVLQAEEIRASPAGRAAAAGLSAQVQWAEGTLRIVQGQARLGGHELTGNGQVVPARKQFEVEATVRSPQLADLGALLGIDLPGGKGTLKLNGRGSVAKPTVHAVLLAHDLALDPWRFGQLLVEADLGADGVVRFPRLVLENSGSYLEGKGSLHLLRADGALHDDLGLDLRFDLDPLEMSDFSAAPLGGNLLLTGRLHVGGSLRQPTAELNLAPSPLNWGKAAGRAQGTARWEAGRLTVAPLTFSNERSAVTLRGAVLWRDPGGQWTSDPRVQADLKAARIFLQDFLPDIKGALSFQAAVEGRISGLKGKFQAEGSDLDTGVQKFSSVRLNGRLADDTVYADHVAVSLAPGQTIEGKGWYAFDQRFQAQLSGDDIALRHIDALQPSDYLQGRLKLNLTAEGSLANPQAAVRLQVRSPRIGDQAWDDFHVRFDLRDRQLAMDADLNFDLAAHYRLDSGDFDFSAVFANTDVGPYLALLAGKHWSGKLSGKIEAAGNVKEPESIDAHLVLTQAAIAHRAVHLLQMDRLEAHMTKGSVSLPATRLALMQNGELVIAAGGHFKRDFAVNVQGRLPLAALAPFAERIADPAGHIRIAAQGQGPLNRMQWRGEVALVRIGLLWADWDQAIRDVNGSVRISPEQVIVDDLSGMLDSGRFRIDGRLQLADWRPTQGQLSLKAQALPVHQPGTMDLLLGADLVLKGNPRQSLLEGEVSLLEGDYYKNVKFDLLSAVTRARRSQPAPRTWSPPQWLSAVALNVTVNSRYPLLVDNNVARMQVAPDFKIGGTAAKPVITGRARVTEGELFFRGKTFAVKRGVVDFLNPYKIEPTVDIAAEAQIRRWTVTLTATGTPDRLAVELSSDPPESDSNILSLILLGRTSAELSKGGGGATTEQMLASLVDSAWGEDLKERAGVDILEVETGAQDEGQNPERIQVTVGKQLSQRFTVKYSVEAAGGETIQRATSEYRLLEHILASGFQDTSGTYGGELLFRIEFR